MFNVGDKVRRVISVDLTGNRPSNGKVWEISCVDPSGYSGDTFIGFADDPEEAGAPVWDSSFFELVEQYNPDEAKPPEVVALDNDLVSTEWTDKHYDFHYKLTQKDIEQGTVKIDPYRVSHQWKLGTKDESGALFHLLKTLARFGDKNSREREIRALYAQIKCLADIEGVEL